MSSKCPSRFGTSWVREYHPAQRCGDVTCGEAEFLDYNSLTFTTSSKVLHKAMLCDHQMDFSITNPENNYSGGSMPRRLPDVFSRQSLRETP